MWMEKGIRKYLRLIKIDEVKQNKIEKKQKKYFKICAEDI